MQLSLWPQYVKYNIIQTLILTCKWRSGRSNSHIDACWWTDSSRIDSYHGHSEAVNKTRIAKHGGILNSHVLPITTTNVDPVQDGYPWQRVRSIPRQKKHACMVHLVCCSQVWYSFQLTCEKQIYIVKHSPHTFGKIPNPQTEAWTFSSSQNFLSKHLFKTGIWSI